MSKNFQWNIAHFNGVEAQTRGICYAYVASDLLSFKLREFTNRRNRPFEELNPSVKELARHVHSKVQHDTWVRKPKDDPNWRPSSVAKALEYVMKCGVAFRRDQPLLGNDNDLVCILDLTRERVQVDGFTIFKQTIVRPDLFYKVEILKDYGTKYPISSPCEENEVLACLRKQILGGSICVYPSFVAHQKGIYMGPTPAELDNEMNDIIDVYSHVVVIYGYGTHKGDDYYYIKNSWGPNWGEGGHAMVLRSLFGEIAFPHNVSVS